MLTEKEGNPMARKAKAKAKTKKTASKTTRRTTTRKTTAKRKPVKRATARRTTTARKTTVKRKTATKKATTRKAAPAKVKTVVKTVVVKKTPLKKAKKINIAALRQAYTKSQIMTYIADSTELSKKEISNVFEALGYLMEFHLKSRGPGEFTVPGLLKCVVKRKPATKARRGINPFTGEEMTFKAKPARNIVKVRPLKKLKDMV
jgi:nucleoid DNA-binding protein